MSNYNSTLQSNNTDLQTILNTINELKSVDDFIIELPSLTNEGTASDLLAGKQLINSGKDIVTGTIETRNSNDLTVNGPTVIIPSGYYANTTTKNVTSAEQAIPSITVDGNGLITATANQNEGYVTSGIKTSTHQLAFQAAKTITPSNINQIAVSSGYYTGGDITVKGDSNLKAENIVNGISIFGVNGTYIVSNIIENTNTIDSFIKRAFYRYENNRVTNIGPYAFASCSLLDTVSFQAVTNIDKYAFAYCSTMNAVNFPAALTIGERAFTNCSFLGLISFPAATTIGSHAFDWCSKSLSSAIFPNVITIHDNAFKSCYKLNTVSFPATTTIGNFAFYNCSSLTTVSFPVATTIGSYAFASCYKLTSLYLVGSSVCTLSNYNVFTSTPIGGYSASAGTYGSIYVPTSLLASYQAATNWTYFSNRFVGV